MRYVSNRIQLTVCMTARGVIDHERGVAARVDEDPQLV
jgi:hypothetical protein